MNSIMRNEYVKYALIGVGTIVILAGVILFAFRYLSKSTYADTADITQDDLLSDYDLKKLIAKEVETNCLENGFLTEDELQNTLTQEMLAEIVDEILSSSGEVIASEVALQMRSSEETDSLIREIAKKYVEKYMKDTQIDKSAFEKLEARIKEIEKNNKNLQQQIYKNNTSNGVAGKNGKDGVGVTVTKSDNGVTVKGANGSATITNGKDGVGATVTQNSDGVTIKGANGSATLTNGKDGVSTFTFYADNENGLNPTVYASESSAYMTSVSAKDETEAWNKLSNARWIKYKDATVVYDASTNTLNISTH